MAVSPSLSHFSQQKATWQRGIEYNQKVSDECSSGVVRWCMRPRPLPGGSICVQWIARDLERLKDPSISEGRREELERQVKSWKEAIQRDQTYIESYDSQLRGESCPKGNKS